MRSTANTSTGGSYCGRAVRGISNLSSEQLREIEAHRAKDRPTPWAHLAQRYGVNEIDLRQYYASASGEAAVEVAQPPPAVHALTLQEQRFRTLWTSGATKESIAGALKISIPTMDRMREKLGLPKRGLGSKPSGWDEAEDRYILENYIRGGKTAEEVAASLGRTRLAVIGRAARHGWTRKAMRSGRLEQYWNNDRGVSGQAA